MTIKITLCFTFHFIDEHGSVLDSYRIQCQFGALLAQQPLQIVYLNSRRRSLKNNTIPPETNKMSTGVFRNILRVPSQRLTQNRSFTVSSHLKSADKVEVTVEQNGIRRIVINRPEAKNALSYGVSEHFLKSIKY